MFIALLVVGCSTKVEVVEEENQPVEVVEPDEVVKVEESDKIEDTINYFEVREWIMKWGKSNTFATVEKCIRKLSENVGKEFPDMKDIHISLTKVPDGEFAVVIEI